MSIGAPAKTAATSMGGATTGFASFTALPSVVSWFPVRLGGGVSIAQEEVKQAPSAAPAPAMPSPAEEALVDGVEPTPEAPAAAAAAAAGDAAPVAPCTAEEASKEGELKSSPGAASAADDDAPPLPSSAGKDGEAPGVAAAATAAKKSAPRKRPAPAPAPAASEDEGRSKRERKKTEIFDMSAKKAVTGVGGDGRPVPSFWGELFHRNVLDPMSGLPVKPHVLQMKGIDAGFYNGCPVEIKKKGVEGGWKKGYVGSVSLDGPYVTLLDGTEVQVDPVDAVRHDKDACGGFSVGRHAQVLFDGGIWYVGVVAQVGGAIGPGDGRGTGGGEGLKMLFEDGDEVVTHTAANDVILLPLEWSESVSQNVWGWWGYNADRVERSKDPPPPPPPVIEEVTGGAAKGKKRRRSGPEPKAVEKEAVVDKKKKKGGAAAAGGAVAEEGGEKKKKDGADKWPWWHTKVPNPWGGGAVKPHVVQMQGSNGRYYVACPVLVLSPAAGGSKKGKKGGGSGGAGGWTKGTVVSLGARGSQKVMLQDGGDMVVDPESSMVKFDREAVEPWAVGRHAQVLFEGGVWFVGIVMSVDKSKKKAKLRFEDGEVQEVELNDKDAVLLPKEWSERVAAEGVWGWWGYNSTRVATIGEINKGKEPIVVLPPLLDEQKQATQPKKRVKQAAQVKGAAPSNTAVAQEPEAGKLLALEAFLPPAPAPKKEAMQAATAIEEGKSGRVRSSLDYSAIAKGPRLDRMAADEESGSDSDDDDDVNAQMNSLGLAISLCDSLRNNAFLGAWEDSASRNKWKQALCKPGNTLAQFGQHIKTFESKLAQSAMSSRYANARASLHVALAEVRDEAHARLCVQLLAGNINPILFKSEQQRAMCAGPFAPSTAKQ